jgi:hypothetical protein
LAGQDTILGHADRRGTIQPKRRSEAEQRLGALLKTRAEALPDRLSDAEWRNPITGIAGCCVPAASG